MHKALAPVTCTMLFMQRCMRFMVSVIMLNVVTLSVVAPYSIVTSNVLILEIVVLSGVESFVQHAGSSLIS